MNTDTVTVKRYASEADVTNLNAAIVALNNAKKAENCSTYSKQLTLALRTCKSLWNAENGI